MNTSFKFKQFSLEQDRCAMKVGTDGVLLGAWATVSHNPFSVLDIGAGTGLIALMLAQRTHAQLIDAIEIDDDAYEQCVENFEASPWNDRLFCYHAGLDEFVDEIDDTYDLIVSNPPFYTEEVSTGDTQRDQARNNFAMPFNELIAASAKLLSPNGIFSVIIPHKEEAHFIKLAEAHQLHPIKITHVKGNTTSAVKRSLLSFSFTKTQPSTTNLVIEKERHVYTDEYIKLTKDFYLKM
jgi:tRNA1Val (adenine37-N6)-methyltransferase